MVTLGRAPRCTARWCSARSTGCCCSASCWAGWPSRRAHHIARRVVLGVVVAVKPSLAPILLIPLVQRRARSRSTGVAGAGSPRSSGCSRPGRPARCAGSGWPPAPPHPRSTRTRRCPGWWPVWAAPARSGWLLTVVVVAASLWWVRGSPQTSRAVGRRAPGGRPADRAPGLVGPPPARRGPADAALFAVTAGCLLAAPDRLAELHGAALAGRAGAGRGRRGGGSVLPLLVVPVIPVAWGNLWQADPHTRRRAARAVAVLPGAARLLGGAAAAVSASRDGGAPGSDDRRQR